MDEFVMSLHIFWLETLEGVKSIRVFFLGVLGFVCYEVSNFGKFLSQCFCVTLMGGFFGCWVRIFWSP